MMLLESKQRFGAVGQGLLYWGGLHLRNVRRLNDRFTYLFDCGSSSKPIHIQKEISLLVPQVPPSNPISLLMISHLDYDHVSGLNSLLQRTTAQTVILPYLEPAERLMLLLRAPQGNDWYKDFLSGPSGFLRKKGIMEIIYLTRGENDDGVPRPEGYESQFSNESDFHLDVKKMEDDPKIQASARGTDLAETAQTAFKKDSRPLSLFPFWQFIFYVSPKPDVQIQQLKQFVDTDFPGVHLANILLDKKKIGILAKQYRKIFHTEDLNHTCLACLHGPLFIGHLPWCRPCDLGLGFPSITWPLWSLIGLPPWRQVHTGMIEEILEVWIHEAQHRGLQNFMPDYTLLMGDLAASQEWERLASRFQHYLQRAQTFQVPHHGARSSWTDAILQSLLGALFIISAGLKNRFGHPHPEVLESLSDAGLAGNVRWVNELSSLADYRVFPLQT